MKVERLLQGIITSAVGLVSAGVVLFKYKDPFTLFLKSNDPLHGVPLLIFLISVVLTAYGVERLSHANQVKERLDKLANAFDDMRVTVSRAVGGQRLVGKHEIYLSPNRLWGKTEHRLRNVIAANGPKSPEEYPKLVAARLRERKEAGHPVRFDVVMVMDPKLISPDAFRVKNDARLQLYDRYGFKGCVHLHILETEHPINFDVSIIDNRHAYIGFTLFDEHQPLSTAVEFADQPELASDLASWYDNVILKHAVPYEQWLRKHFRHPDGMVAAPTGGTTVMSETA